MDQTLDFLKEDFSAEVTAKIPEYVGPAKKDKSKMKDALDKLLTLEKKTRLAADQKSTTMLANAMVHLCKDCGAWKELNEYIELLSKRRAQMKKVVQSIVQEAMTFLDDTPDKESKIALLETLRTVTAGKMYVELERARMTRILVEMKEADGDVAGAADMLQDVSVETIGSMEAREKLEFILEQVRLCMAKKDFVRAEIVSKKVTSKHIAKEDLSDLRIKYYKLMIAMHAQKDAYLETCKAYDAMYQTKSVQDDETAWKENLSKAITFLALSPFDHDMNELLQRFKADERTDQLPAFKAILTALSTEELITWPLQSEPQIRALAEFQGEKQESLMADLHKRTVQHNIRVVSKYYQRLTSARLAELLLLDQDKTEAFLSEMVSSKQLFARIDRRAKTVTFEKTQSPAVRLNSWADDISSLLTLVDKTCHLINKENMVHGVK